MGREKRRKLTEGAARATKRSSWAAWASTFAAGFLLIITIADFCKVDKISPLLIDIQKQSRKSEVKFMELQNEIQLLKSKIQGLETQRANIDTLSSKAKTHK